MPLGLLHILIVPMEDWWRRDPVPDSIHVHLDFEAH